MVKFTHSLYELIAFLASPGLMVYVFIVAGEIVTMPVIFAVQLFCIGK